MLFLRLCIHNVYTQYIYEHTALYTYTLPHWKPLHQLCSRSGYGPKLKRIELLLEAQVNLSLHLVKLHDMTSYREVEVGLWICAFLASELGGDEWSASRPSRLRSLH
jgi:hypothetical protein